MRVLHMATLLWGLVGTLAGLAMTRVHTALDAWWTLAGIFGGGMLGLFLLGRLSSRVDHRAALTGVAAGVTVILWSALVRPGSFLWTYVESYPRIRTWANPLDPLLTIVLGTATIITVGLASALVYGNRRPPGDATSDAPGRLSS